MKRHVCENNFCVVDLINFCFQTNESQISGSQKIIWMYPNLKQTKRTVLIDTSKAPFENEENAVLWTLERKEEFEKKREKQGRDDQEEDFLFHCSLMNIFAMSTAGLNQSTEAICQELVPASVCFEVLMSSWQKVDVKMKTVREKFQFSAKY